eukprot:TRINITY_DN2226_c0_g1_i1.p1 TRINITY_DN2226_c0_g1~~TRINITY_DN2226_c0_g1_i1.p1  ORF type:complete len:323 (+),score=135.21 TRINITY_DN2226_c0_g1_i1:57-1025(+)
MGRRKKTEDLDPMEDEEEDQAEYEEDSGEDDPMGEEPEEQKEEEDLYSILGLSKGASEKDIKQAYYKQALKVHPDRNPGDKSANVFFFKQKTAYEILSDPKKKAYYDETGSVLDADGFGSFAGNKSAKDWDEYWRVLFKRVSEDDINSFSKSYKYTAEEQKDLKATYTKVKGDMHLLMESIILSTEDDTDRFIEDIRKYIAAGELKKFAAFEKTAKELQSAHSKAARKSKSEEEEKEAEELIKKIQNRNRERNGGANDAQALVTTKKKTKQQKDMDDLVAKLQNKYGSKKGGKSTKMADEPSEEEFQKARERLEKGKKRPRS